MHRSDWFRANMGFPNTAAEMLTKLSLDGGVTFTQTYATADATVAAPTAAAPGAVTNYTAVSTTNPVTNTEGDAISTALALLEDEVTANRAEVVKLVADNLDNRKTINSLIDALQAAGIA